MMIAYPTTRQQDTATNDIVHRLRDIVLPQATAGTGIRACVGGPNAGAVDFADLVNQRLPWLIGIVAGLSVLLLMVVFRSVTVAIKAAVMNLLSISPPTACSPQSCNGVLAVWAGNTPGPRVWSGTSEGERQLLRSRGSDGMPGRRWCRARSLVRSACR